MVVVSNFHQLLLLRAKNNPTVLDIMQHKAWKYTDHHIQNVTNLGSRSFMQCTQISSLEADEVTDSSNKKQLVVCLRFVDNHLEPHEECIRLRTLLLKQLWLY